MVCSCTHSHTCKHTHTHPHTHEYIHTHIHTHTHMQAHTHTHTLSHTHTHTYTLTHTGNIECRGENILDRQEFCHFDPTFRHMCGPPPVLILNNISIQPEGAPLDREVCTCGFSAGKFVCLPRKFNVRSESVMCNILMYSKAWYLGVLHGHAPYM